MTVHCGPLNRQALSVFTPLLLAEGGAVFPIEGVVKGAAESPAWRQLYAYDAEVFSPVVGSEPITDGQGHSSFCRSRRPASERLI